ncbi:MAG: SDR family NAD(P)-dependent oxidoreductase [bacterium]|jgi:3-oxoacyl-[acyl-carrier protein] reductase|nr:SDR family oxidoreductase [Gemmatimonadota bacterium]HIL89144.1 SDR family oxidoreductase [Gemmatimonadota bacterium]
MTGPTRSALVTGAAQGIGLECAERLLQDGLRVVATDINADRNVSFPAGDSGGQFLQLDVTDLDAVTTLVSEAGPFDVLVNSAGIVGPNTVLWEVEPDEWKKTLEVNLTGTFNTIRSVVPHMRHKGWGRIVNIASIAGKEGNPKLSAYSASKAAVIGLTKSVGKELATENVLVNAIAPAVIATPMNENTAPEVLDYMLSKIPMGRIGEAAEVAELVSWLCSDRCSFSTAAVYDISGGRATY